jgi:hypothetical protein
VNAGLGGLFRPHVEHEARQAGLPYELVYEFEGAVIEGMKPA